MRRAARPMSAVNETLSLTELEVNTMSYDIGEKPGKGTYRDAFGHRVTLDDASDVLPPCPSCGPGQRTRWTRA